MTWIITWLATNWISALKVAVPIALMGTFGLWAHHSGWEERDATVAQEKKDAVNDAVDQERSACEMDLTTMEGISDVLQKSGDAANAKYADAVGQLYDATHNPGKREGKPTSAGSDNGPPGPGRLYYADTAGALPALDRANIATKQANQLIGCQSYVHSVSGGK